MKSSYLALHESGKLADRIDTARDLLENCCLCPRECEVNRIEGELGFCRTGRKSVVASYNAHFGEESPLVGDHGSGTIFFAGCNLGCRFCQNDDISYDAINGLEAEPDELAGVMLQLQQQGCHNINLVTPSHVVAQILEALPIAIEYGLNLPLVYNTSAYDSLAALRLLDGVIDIYMPDLKIWDSEYAKRFLRAKDYPQQARKAVREMHRQVGDLVLDEDGVAQRGLIVRHLVMPDDVAGTEQWMKFLAGTSKQTYLNIMDQYRPCAEAGDLPPLDRSISSKEFRAAKEAASKYGLSRLDKREDRGLFRLIMNQG